MKLSSLSLGILSFLTFVNGRYLRISNLDKDDWYIGRMLQHLIKRNGQWGYWIIEKGYYKNGKFYCTRNCVSDKEMKTKNHKRENPKPTHNPTAKHEKKPFVSKNEFSERIFPWILRWEGRTFVNNPKDTGGCTKYGISYNNNKAYLNAIGINSGPEIEKLTETQAENIYRKKYWDPVAGSLTYPMNWVYFNAAVNNGPGNAEKFYSKSHGNYNTFIEIQKKFYNDLVKNNPSQNIFLKGWLNRLNSLSLCVDSETYSQALCK
jgi:hypothetical protein